MYDIVIIGAGCAGMTAAVYAQRAGKKSLILEKETFGGQISFSPCVENFPSIKKISGNEFSDQLFEQATSLGSDAELENVLEITNDGDFKIVKTDYNTYKCKAVIIATGVLHRHLGLPFEDDFIGAGISFCAVCDGAFYKNKTVAVVGGGNTALQDAIYLSDFCKKVYLIHRRDSFRGEQHLVDVISKKDNIALVLDSVVTSLCGENALDGIDVQNVKTNATSHLDIDGLFVAIGQIPNNSAFSSIVNLDEQGFIIADETCKTNTSGIFVAGDCRTKEVRQLTTAAADGATSAIAACKYIDSL